MKIVPYCLIFPPVIPLVKHLFQAGEQAKTLTSYHACAHGILLSICVAGNERHTPAFVGKTSLKWKTPNGTGDSRFWQQVLE